MKERFISTFEEVLAANRDGEVRNLLITDNDAEFLDDAFYQLRYWCNKNGLNLVEIDEKDDSWLPEIKSRELYDKLNLPSTILLIKNYATVAYRPGDDNTPRNLLRDAIMNRHYGCGNDFVPSDDLPNLLFVVALNDLSEMKWRKDEYECFAVIHRDDGKKVWTNTNFTLMSSKMHPVMSAVNRLVYWVSDDETTLSFEAGKAFGEGLLKRPLRHFTADDRTEIIHSFLENNLPAFNDRVECLLFSMDRFGKDERFTIDSKRLKQIFPALGCICLSDSFDISSADNIQVLDSFELGELSFKYAREGDFETANSLVRKLWALDRRWARFFREVAKDYYRKPEDHAKIDSDASGSVWTGMDHLFHIYLLGWYHKGDDFFDEEDKVFVAKHKDFNKAIDLLPVRFQNCSVDEVVDKLYWDLEHIKKDANPDYGQFASVLAEAENLFPGVSAKMRENGWMN